MYISNYEDVGFLSTSLEDVLEVQNDHYDPSSEVPEFRTFDNPSF